MGLLRSVYCRKLRPPIAIIFLQRLILGSIAHYSLHKYTYSTTLAICRNLFGDQFVFKVEFSQIQSVEVHWLRFKPLPIHFNVDVISFQPLLQFIFRYAIGLLSSITLLARLTFATRSNPNVIITMHNNGNVENKTDRNISQETQSPALQKRVGLCNKISI